MNARPSARDRRALWIGGLSVTLAAVIRFVILPYLSKESSLRAEITREERMLLHDQVVLRDAGAFPGQFQEAAADLYRFAPRLLADGTETAVQAAIVRDVESAARDGRVRLDRLEPLASATVAAGVRSHGCRVDGEGDLEGILTLLSELEASPTLMRVTDLSISRSATVESDVSDPETLRVRFTVTGFRLVAGADSVAPAAREGA